MSIELSPSDPSESPVLPLTGIRVVEAAQMISAPFATSILADQGADVVKVEALSGDRMRSLGDIRNEMGSLFHTCNRGKRSIALDTKSDAGRDALIRLIDQADVFVQNFRPGAVDRMGVGPEEMRARNPRLVYVSVSGFGQDGPYADQMVYDFVIQGVTGLASFEGGDSASGEGPRLTKNLVIDKATALTVSQAITSALLLRERTGEGQHLEVDMLSAGLQFVWPDVMWHETLPGDDVTRIPHMARNYEVRPTKDGHVTLNLATNSTWPRLCAAIAPSLADDPRFVTFADRQRNSRELAAAVDEVLNTLTTAEVIARMRANDLPGGPVLSPAQVAEDPQVMHNDVLVASESASIGPVLQPRPAARFGAAKTPPPASAPRLGEHSEEVLAEAGFADTDIAALRSTGVIG